MSFASVFLFILKKRDEIKYWEYLSIIYVLSCSVLCVSYFVLTVFCKFLCFKAQSSRVCVLGLVRLPLNSLHAWYLIFTQIRN